MKCRLLLILSVLINTVPRLLDVSTVKVIRGDMTEQQMALYFKGDALSFFVMMLAFMFKDKSHETDIYVWWVLGLTLSNACDELIFNPYYLQIGEIMLVSLITVVSIFAMQVHKGRKWAIVIFEFVDDIYNYIPNLLHEKCQNRESKFH